MIKPYTNLYDEVLPDVPGVPQPVALNAIRNAVIEFCERSRIWVIDHDPIAAIANESTYQFEPPNGAVIAGVVTAWFDGKRIDPTTQGILSEVSANWTADIGTPVAYLQENTEELILHPKPASALKNALTMKVALKPTRKSVGVEGWILEMYQEEIAHGAKGKLFAMQKKPWSNNELSVFHMGVFDTAIAKARDYASRGMGKARMRTIARFL